MNSEEARQSRWWRPEPPTVNHSLFSYIALWLAVLMIVPASILVGPATKAWADGPNGSCEVICTRIDPPICTTDPVTGAQLCEDLSCQEDANDPDCFLLGATSYCFCNDGTASVIQGDATPTTCDTSATCLNHCGPFDPLHPEDICYGGPPIQLGGCGTLQFFNGGNVCSADVRAFDPDTGAALVNQTVLAGPQLQALETQAIDEVLHNHGLADTERANVTIWARALVRAQLFSHFVEIINAPPSNAGPQPTPGNDPQPTPSASPQPRTADEQVLYDWLTNLVWQKRIDAAQESWQQFLGWRNSVDFATCAWHSPNDKGIVEPKGSGTITQPGCSPGVDGVPGTDATPNAASNVDLALGCSDGETCFTFNDFRPPENGGDLTPYYDSNTLSRCAGAPTSGDIFGIAAHPSIEEFLKYGKGLARRKLTLDPGFASVVGNTSRAVFLPIALGTSGLAAGITGAAVYSEGGWESFAKVVFPYALRQARAALAAVEGAADAAASALRATAASIRLISAIGAASVVFEVVFNILTAIEAIVEIVELNNIPVVLKSYVRASAGTTESSIHIQPLGTGDTVTTGKPDLTKLIQTADGKEEIFYAFLEAVGPEADLSNATAPQPDSSLLWSVRDASTNQSVPSTPPNLLAFTSWDDDAPWTDQTAGLNNGWFVVSTVPPAVSSGLADEITAAVEEARTKKKSVCSVAHDKGIDTSTLALFIGNGSALDLGIDYKDCAGKEHVAYRVAGNEFVSVPNGTTGDDTDLTQTTRSRELQYQDSDGNCRIARINQAPTATISMVSGTLQEGSAVSFGGTGNDPDGDAVTLAWDFGDGSAAAMGASVQHTFSDNGTYTVKLTPTDGPGANGPAKTQIVTIANALPVIGTINGPTGRVHPNTAVNLSASFTDAGVADTHTATWDWGDGIVTTGTVQEASGSGTVTGSHPYTKGGSYSVKLTVTDDDTGAAQKTFAVSVNKRLSALDPAKIWIGMKNSDDAAMPLDLQAEVLVNGAVVGSGQLANFKGGSSGFANAILQTVPLTLSSTPELSENATLAVRIGVRATCALGGNRAGWPRLWYDGAAIDTGKTADAGSRATVQLDTDKTTYFLRSGTPLGLSSTAGTSKQSIDVNVDSKVKCPNRPFTPIGTWSVTIP